MTTADEKDGPGLSRDEKYLRLLELAVQRKWHLHNALWEEEKHYTWWVYIVFAAVLYVYVSSGWLSPLHKAVLVVGGSLLGAGISAIGYFVVRREGENFGEAREMCDHTRIALGLEEPVTCARTGDIDLVPRHHLQDPRPLDGAARRANKDLWDLLRAPYHTLRAALSRRKDDADRRDQEAQGKKLPELGIRDCFQLTFLAAIGAFLLFCIFALCTLPAAAAGQ